MKKFKLISLTLIAILSQASFAINLSYKKVSSVEFIWVLKNKSSLELQAAQNFIYQGAKDLCEGLIPAFGKYEFKSFNEVSSNEKSKDAEEFHFLQHIKCVEDIPAPAVESILELSELQEQLIKDSAKHLTLEYLSAKNLDEYKKAYSMLTVNMQELSSFDKWKTRESNYAQNVGGELKTDIWRMTIYNNPPNSPKPGLYIAADYESEFEKSSIHCGFIIWYASNDNLNDFKVMREEYGNISNDIFAKLSVSELPNVRQQIGCRPVK